MGLGMGICGTVSAQAVPAANIKPMTVRILFRIVFLPGGGNISSGLEVHERPQSQIAITDEIADLRAARRGKPHDGHPMPPRKSGDAHRVVGVALYGLHDPGMFRVVFCCSCCETS